MRPAELELLVIELVEAVLRLQPVDDPRVAFKRAWPEDAGAAARELAGAANAARGEPVLWLIGVDEDSGAVHACNREDLAGWYGNVCAWFDGITPTLEQSLELVIAGEPVVALLFATQRAPFAVRPAATDASIQREIPWREAKATRSATREELLRMLVPAARLPAASVQSGILTYCWNPKEVPWMLWLDVYLVPNGSERVVLPHHQCWAQVSQGPYEIWRAPALGAPHEIAPTIHKGPSELILDGPGLARFNAMYEIQDAAFDRDQAVTISVYACPAGAETSLVMSSLLRPQPALSSEEQTGWSLEPRAPWEQ